MSELSTQGMNSEGIRKHLLATASMLAFFVSATSLSATANAADADKDRPTVWIELGGQLERVDGGQDRFMPLFSTEVISAGFQSPAIAQTPPRYAVGGEIKASFIPKGSDWIFSIGARYGRSNGAKHIHEQDTVQSTYVLNGQQVIATQQLASDSKTQENESHSVLDFQAGRDIGVGLFGGGTADISGGIRIAQFTSTSKDTLIARPRYGFDPLVVIGLHFLNKTRYDYHGIAENDRSFRGIGPSLAWNSSTPIGADGGFAFDWGLNGAILFGRQKSTGHHQTTAYHYVEKYGPQRHPLYQLAYPKQSTDHARSHSVVVPNIGGFAGLSLRWPNARLSVGYRGDFFFGAMDGGIDSRESKARNFYGPYASISIGLGG